jgi:hypothetical protein
MFRVPTPEQRYHFPAIRANRFLSCGTATSLPPGEIATDQTCLVWPLRVASSFAVAALQSYTDLSQPPEASTRSPAEKLTANTGSLCPSKAIRSLPVVVSQSLTSTG